MATDDLLSGPPPSIRLVIPGVCFMEAFSAFKREQIRLNGFVGDLDRQIQQLKRNVASPGVFPLIDHLDKVVSGLQAVFNDSRARLYDAIQKLGTSAEFIGLSSEILGASLSGP